MTPTQTLVADIEKSISHTQHLVSRLRMLMGDTTPSEPSEPNEDQGEVILHVSKFTEPLPPHEIRWEDRTTELTIENDGVLTVDSLFSFFDPTGLMEAQGFYKNNRLQVNLLHVYQNGELQCGYAYRTRSGQFVEDIQGDEVEFPANQYDKIMLDHSFPVNEGDEIVVHLSAPGILHNYYAPAHGFQVSVDLTLE